MNTCSELFISLAALSHAASAFQTMSHISAQHCSVHYGLCSWGLCHITSSIINQKVLTAKPTYLYVRERVISTPSSPLHSKPWENPTHLYNQLSWICMWLLLLSSFLSPSLATVFISPGIVTYWRWGSQVSYGQPGCYIYTAGKSVATLSFLSLKTEKQGGIPMHLRYFYGPPQSPIFQLFWGRSSITQFRQNHQHPR